MRCTPSDPCGIHAPTGNFLRAMVALPRLVIWHEPCWPRLRLLTGTRSQQAAIVLAVRPVVRELVPNLEATGVEVSSISLLHALVSTAGEPLQAQVEQLAGARSFVIRLAHTAGGVLRRPEEVAGALAEELLGLYREAAAVRIVRQTPAPIPAAVLAGEEARVRMDSRLGLVPGARDQAEGAVIPFTPSPFGGSTNGHAG